MDINRNQFFMAGLVVLLLGLQFRAVDAFVLNEPTSQFVAEKLRNKSAGNSERARPVALSVAPRAQPSREVVRPPKWVGWALISVGGVLMFHSLAMPKPE